MDFVRNLRIVSGDEIIKESRVSEEVKAGQETKFKP